MSKRLQVLLEPAEYKGFQKIARARGLSLGEWVRQALRKMAGEFSRKSPEEKLAALKAAAKNDFPTADIGKMLLEIEKGRLG